MKTHHRTLAATLAGLALAAAAGAADLSLAVRARDDSPLRVLASTDRERVVVGQAADRHEPAEKEQVTFLGVNTAPVSATLTAQLGLAEGTGLVVNGIVAKSPAEGVLRPHDILLKFDDQIVVEPRQLAVLVRNRKEGDEVKLTYLRAGKEAVATVKLERREVSKASAFFGTPGSGGAFEFAGPLQFPHDERDAADRMLSLLGRARESAPPKIVFERKARPGSFHATAIDTANSKFLFRDDRGSLELTVKDGVRTLEARDDKGQSLFSGPVTTPEERKAVPPAVLERLEQLESLHNVTFRTDGNFRSETRIVRPLGRSIVLPAVPAAPLRPGSSY